MQGFFVSFFGLQTHIGNVYFVHAVSMRIICCLGKLYMCEHTGRQ